MATTTRRVATEEDLLAMPPDGHKYELVDGEIRMSPAGDRREAGTNAAASASGMTRFRSGTKNLTSFVV
jgi:hypothetical protein